MLDDKINCPAALSTSPGEFKVLRGVVRFSGKKQGSPRRCKVLQENFDFPAPLQSYLGKNKMPHGIVKLSKKKQRSPARGKVIHGKTKLFRPK